MALEDVKHGIELTDETSLIGEDGRAKEGFLRGNRYYLSHFGHKKANCVQISKEVSTAVGADVICEYSYMRVFGSRPLWTNQAEGELSVELPKTATNAQCVAFLNAVDQAYALTKPLETKKDPTPPPPPNAVERRRSIWDLFRGS